MANEKQKAECEACPNVDILAPLNGMQLCASCYAKELLTTSRSEAKPVVEVEPSISPIQIRLKNAYIEKTNTILVSGMTHEQLREHLADLEDQIKVFQTQVQAVMDIDEQWARDLTAEEREALRLKDKQYRAKARPTMNADGTLKLRPKSAPKEVIVGDAGDKAFEGLVRKLEKTGMSRDQAIKVIESTRGKK